MPKRSPNRTVSAAKIAPRQDRRQETSTTRPYVWIVLLLTLAVLIPYLQVLHFDFVSYDDPDYVTANPHVQSGLTSAGIAWAFRTSFAGNWFPLTWLSHMLDCQLFGLNAGRHHLTSVLIHLLTTILLFAFLARITGAVWKSAVVAVLFATHPLHVESVTWIAERKDVLSGLFGVLTLWAYVLYADRPRWPRYALVLIAFCLGLMAKPMLVTLPVLLLLLDYWPLKRGVRILEKLPLFALSLAVCAITYIVHRHAGATASLEQIPLIPRLENSLVSYVVYILKTVWPVNLAVFYPFPYPWDTLAVPAVLAAVALAAISWLTWRARADHPFAPVGWLWYVVTLLPVIGIVQVGAQARADRYTYIPSIGLSILLVWGVGAALERWPGVRKALAVAVCVACLALTWIQLQYWRDSVTLYEHAIASTSNNYLAHFNLAGVLDGRGDRLQAIDHLREAVRIRPNSASAHGELGQLLAKEGQAQDAIQELQSAVALNPDSAEVHFRLGSVLGALGRNSEAAGQFHRVVQIDPENADGHFDLGIALAQEGNVPEAAQEFRETVRLRPEDVDARFNLGIALLKSGQTDDSARQLAEVVRLKPDFKEAREALAEANRKSEEHRK